MIRDRSLSDPFFFFRFCTDYTRNLCVFSEKARSKFDLLQPSAKLTWFLNKCFGEDRGIKGQKGGTESEFRQRVWNVGEGRIKKYFEKVSLVEDEMSEQ